MSFTKILPIIEHISLLGGINKRGVKKIVRLAKFEKFRSGQTIFREGELSDKIYILLSGKVGLMLNAPLDGVEWLTLREGDCFGEEATIGIQHHSVTAVCEEDTEVMVINDENLMRVYESDPRLFSLLILNIAREVCRRLYHSNRMLASTPQQLPRYARS